MDRGGRPLTIGARVNESEQGRIDAAARLVRMSRAEFIATAALRAADKVLRDACSEAP